MDSPEPTIMLASIVQTYNLTPMHRRHKQWLARSTFSTEHEEGRLQLSQALYTPRRHPHTITALTHHLRSVSDVVLEEFLIVNLAVSVRVHVGKHFLEEPGWAQH